jgi:hypothetical protein
MPIVRRLAMLLATGALALTAAPTLAHHSFAMFDRNNQVDLEGVVQEFSFANSHTFIYLAVKQDDGSTVTWALEGQSPSLLAREGWTSRTLKPGDELKMRIAPLRSGAPGGAWAADQISFREGRVLDVSHRTAGFPESSRNASQWSGFSPTKLRFAAPSPICSSTHGQSHCGESLRGGQLRCRI